MPAIPKNFKPVPYEYHQQIELTIDTLTNLGLGLGRVDGWVIMVPLVLPGERVRVRVWRNKANYSEADLVEILEASPERVAPRCPLFGECGGCQYQHLSYKGQLEWKSRHVQELVTRLAKLDLAVEPSWPSPLAFGYRSKITPHYEPRGQQPMHIGFQGMSTRAIIDVPQCPIASDAINAALPVERERLLKRQHSLKRGGTLLLRDLGDGHVETDMRATAEASVGKLRFRFQAGEFFQNNPHILTELLDYVMKEAAAEGLDCLVDAYCGAGSFALWGADRFEKVAGIEISERAIELAKENAALNGIANVSFVPGSAEAIFSQIDFAPSRSALIIDPPRRGCDEVFLDQLVRWGPARVVYVSCGPDTQARDLQYLSQHGYKVEKVQPFDLFPQTRHIESVATIVRS
ncbi:MAG: 23S rRNA (uracil(1939)-C(5))-methyltransferase RlmD [Opitutales bacterium]|nr:23S rRNA (uracil(1939)-C(5))-methyltransferase RlmD [Opitutales bacterium]